MKAFTLTAIALTLLAATASAQRPTHPLTTIVDPSETPTGMPPMRTGYPTLAPGATSSGRSRGGRGGRSGNDENDSEDNDKKGDAFDPKNPLFIVGCVVGAALVVGIALVGYRTFGKKDTAARSAIEASSSAPDVVAVQVSDVPSGVTPCQAAVIADEEDMGSAPVVGTVIVGPAPSKGCSSSDCSDPFGACGDVAVPALHRAAADTDDRDVA